MSSLKDEELVVRLLANKGLRAERFSKTEIRQGKTPDFRVFHDEELKFYCEVKSVEKDTWLDKKLNAATPGEIVGGFRDDPVFNRLTDDIHKAVAQFLAVNPDTAIPNVMVFVNHDSMCDEQDMIAVLTGQFLAEVPPIEYMQSFPREGSSTRSMPFISFVGSKKSASAL